MIKACEICGAAFEARGSAKVCSDKCRREKERERKRRYREENREKEAKRHRRYYEENPEKVRERKRRYYEEQRLTRDFFRRLAMADAIRKAM